jgi:dimethylargininase
MTFRFSRAIVRKIDPSLTCMALRTTPNQFLSQPKAQLQHDHYVRLLQSLGITTYELESDGHPDSVFIEDTAVVAGNKVLVTHPGAKSRQGEVLSVKRHFQQHYLNLELHSMEQGNLDGGDVLFTGEAFLVGLSQRTNLAGIQELQDFFAPIPVYYLHLQSLIDQSMKLYNQSPALYENPKFLLHMKSCCSMISSSTVITGGVYGETLQSWLNKSSQDSSNSEENPIRCLSKSKSVAPLSVQSIWVPNQDAANVLLANNWVIHRGHKKYPQSFPIIRKFCYERGLHSMEIEYDELAKVDGALTCCSLLIQ